jgi:hypothetical protein
MASDNLDALFQMARSYDISLIIANQSIEDLGAQGSKLLNVVETTCHLRQWFSVSGRHDLNLVQMLAGTRDKLEVTTTIRSDGNGSHMSQASRVKEVARLTVDDLLYLSTQKDLCVLRLTGSRTGYAHYQGLPMVVRSQFHISQKNPVKTVPSMTL